MASSNRSKFLEMCEGLLARVEPPLRSVLEQASKCVCVSRVLLPERHLSNTGFLWVGIELGQRVVTTKQETNFLPHTS